MKENGSTLVIDLDYLNSYIHRFKDRISPLNAEIAVERFLSKLYRIIPSPIDNKHLIYTTENEVEPEYVKVWKGFELHRNVSGNKCFRCNKCGKSEKIKAIADLIRWNFTVLSPSLVSLLAEIMTLKFDKRQINHSYLVLLGKPKDYDCILRIVRRRLGKICILSTQEEKASNSHDKFMELSEVFNMKDLPENNEEIKRLNSQIQPHVLLLLKPYLDYIS